MRKYFIHKIENNEAGEVVAVCNEYNIENKKLYLSPGEYMVISENVEYKFRR